MKAPYFGLWAILVCALVAVAFFAFTETKVVIGERELKKAPIPSALGLVVDSGKITSAPDLRQSPVAQTPAPRKAATAEPDAPEEAYVPQQYIPEVPEPVDSGAQSILLFGDSMTMNLAYRLAEYAKANGHTFHAVNWDSSNTKIWAETDTLQYFINKFHPTYFFISLGSNEMFFKDPSSRLPYVKRIIGKLGGAPYIWIGPPNKKEDSALSRMLEANLRPGAYFRTDGMKFELQHDHIHPTRSASAVWIDSVMSWIPMSANPILLEKPSDSIGKVVPKLVILKALNK